MIRLAALFALVLPLLAAGAAPAQDYLIKRGDTLRIEVIEDSSLNRSVLVSPDGRINVPLAGSVGAAGRTVEQVQAQLVTALTPQFAAPPNVYVAVERVAEPRGGTGGPRVPAAPATVDVYLMGEVNAPGKFAVEEGTTVLQLFAETKGFTRFAATRRIQLRRTENGVERVYPLNYEAILAGRSPNGRVTVQDGDVFVVPVRRLFE